MSSDAHSSSSSSESDGESRERPGMVGFMFGNVDSRMQLQDDYLGEARDSDLRTCQNVCCGLRAGGLMSTSMHSRVLQRHGDSERLQ